jgi:hypothetical protein
MWEAETGMIMVETNLGKKFMRAYFSYVEKHKTGIKQDRI